MSCIMLSIIRLQFSTIRFICAGSAPFIIPIIPRPRPPIIPVSGLPLCLSGSCAVAIEAIVPRLRLSARAVMVSNFWLSISVLLGLACLLLSCYADNGHHPGLLMIGDVAMQHPNPGVIGDEGNLGGFTSRDQNGVPPFPKFVRFAVPADDAEAVPV